MLAAASSSSHGICQEGVLRRPRDLERLSEVSSQKSCLNEVAAVIGLVGCDESAAVIGWISRSLLRLVVRTQTPCSAA